MNLFPLLDPWLPVGFMAAEVAVVALLRHIVLRLVSRPKWQKIICQTAVLTVLLLVGCEFMGLSNLLVARLGLKDFKRTAGNRYSAVMERKEAVSNPAPALAAADEPA